MTRRKKSERDEGKGWRGRGKSESKKTALRGTEFVNGPFRNRRKAPEILGCRSFGFASIVQLHSQAARQQAATWRLAFKHRHEKDKNVQHTGMSISKQEKIYKVPRKVTYKLDD